MTLVLGRDRTVATIHPGAELVPMVRFGPFELDTIHLLLRGTSVVDWFRLHFRSREEIDAFFRINELYLDRASDRAYIGRLKHRAIAYLKDHLRYRRVPDSVTECDVVGLFDYASGKGRRVHRFYACLVLKVMHLLHYIAAHELLAALPITQAEVSVLLRAKVERVVRGFLERNFPIVAFNGNMKTHHSTVSKLLAKRESQAAQVFDKLRFRFIVARLEDVPPLLVALTRELVPFNYIVPDQANNTLVDLPTMLVRAGNLHAIRAQQPHVSASQASAPQTGAESSPRQADSQSAGSRDGAPRREAILNEAMEMFATGQRNEFSGPDYRVVNFIAEVPIRLDDVVWEPVIGGENRGPVAFGTVEFQVLDQITAKRNETGPNRHALYKGRQRSRVRHRLERGKRGVAPPPVGGEREDSTEG